MIQDTAAAPHLCPACASSPVATQGLGSITIGKYTLDWKTVAIGLLVAALIYHYVVKPSRTRRAVRRRLDASTW